MNKIEKIDDTGQVPTIAVINHGLGNWRSVQKALEYVGAEAPRTDERQTILAADGLVLPGVGAFPEVMRRMAERDLVDPIKRFKKLGKPILGICLGHQLLFEASEEQEYTKGLGLLPGVVRRAGGFNVGWSRVTFTRDASLTDGITKKFFYHLHCCVAVPEDSSVVTVESPFGLPSGEVRTVVGAVQHENLYGVQFHPEKSGKSPGLELIRNFVQICANDTAGL
ncbi:MAG TPA: imidazole glycerol phosphate synthase subunit HisH [Candidatus Saccharimonadales bacterium]|nr:imidazole glycerol phosphate synthase subunit HisH [Candidatus Saccharimonadales bacterium]